MRRLSILVAAIIAVLSANLSAQQVGRFAWVQLTPDARTIASNGTGTAATLTLSPLTGYVPITCNDPDTCAITMSEAGIPNGFQLLIVNLGPQIITFANQTGVLVLASSPKSLGTGKTLLLIYAVDHWNEMATLAGSAPPDAQYWTGASDATLTAEKNLGALSTGLVINTAGVPSAYTGSSCTNQFLRTLDASGAGTCASVSLTADVSGTLPGTSGGTGNAFFAVSGPTTSLKTFTFPNASATVLTDNAAVTIAQGGTGTTSFADDTVPLSNGSVLQAKTVPDCTDTGGNHLNYTASTNTFSCGTTGDGTGAGGSVTTTGSPSSGQMAKFSGATSITNATAGTDYAAVTWQPPVNLRCSLTTNTYVTTTDVTGATTLYWTTAISGGTGVVTGYNGSALARKAVTQKSLALGTLTSGANYNVYYDYDGDALALGAAWTNDTTPSETLADESGAAVLSTDHTKLYICLIRTTSTTATEDSAAKRFVWNAFNQVRRQMVNATETTDQWNYTLAAFHQANANAANQLAYVTGDAAALLEAHVYAMMTNTNTGVGAAAGVGVDSTTVNSAQYHGTNTGGTSGIVVVQNAIYSGAPGLGYHYLAWLEYSNATGTATWFGDAGNATLFQSGIIGTIWN